MPKALEIARLRRGLLGALASRIQATEQIVIPALHQVAGGLSEYAATKGDFKPINFLAKRAVRALFGWFEATTGFMLSAIVEHGQRLEAPISPGDAEVISKLAGRGPGDSSVRRGFHLGLDARMKVTLRNFPKLFGSSFQPDFNDKAGEWHQMTELCKIRNGFTHPSRFIDLLGERAIPLLIPATGWFGDQVLGTFSACAEAAGIVVPALTGPSISAHLPKFNASMKRAPERIFDKTFDKEVAEHGSRSIRLLGEWRPIHHFEHIRSYEDLSTALSGGAGDCDLLYRRDFVLALAANAESTIGFLDWYLDAAQERGELVRTQNSVGAVRAGRSVAVRLVGVLNEFGSIVGLGKVMEAESADYLAFARLLSVRDRLIHPSADKDLVLTESELLDGLKAWRWYCGSYEVLEFDLERVGPRAGAYLPNTYAN